jgi:hypothetical protein
MDGIGSPAAVGNTNLGNPFLYEWKNIAKTN